MAKIRYWDVGWLFFKPKYKIHVIKKIKNAERKEAAL